MAGKIFVIYYSRTGHTEKMARAVSEGVSKEGLQADLRRVEDTDPGDLLEAAGIIIGSPTYYGSMAAPVKAFLDESVKFHGRYRDKVGGAFTSSNALGGGNETTILSILQALLVHGMIIQGTHSGGHYGPVALGKPDDKALRECIELGARVANLAKKVI